MKIYSLKLNTSLFVVLLITSVFFGCGSQKEIDKIGDAQQCLNKSTSSTAMECATKVEGMSSSGAYNIRCAAAFVREGFANPTKYTTAFNTLSGSSGTTGFMGIITFSSTGAIATDAVNANTTYTDCFNAIAKGKTLISSFGYLSTALLKFFADNGGGQKCSVPTSTSAGYDLATCITNAVNPTTNTGGVTGVTNVLKIADSTADASSSAGQVQTSIGSIIISTYQISCSTSGANKDLCEKLTTSINQGGGTSNPRGVAIKFFTAILGIPAS